MVPKITRKKRLVREVLIRMSRGYNRLGEFGYEVDQLLAYVPDEELEKFIKEDTDAWGEVEEF